MELPPYYPTIDDCECIVVTLGAIQLLAFSKHTGPYVIRVGKVPVGAFGYDSSNMPIEGITSPRHPVQLESLEMACSAFELIRQQTMKALSTSELREIARNVYRDVRMAYYQGMQLKIRILTRGC